MPRGRKKAAHVEDIYENGSSQLNVKVSTRTRKNVELLAKLQGKPVYLFVEETLAEKCSAVIPEIKALVDAADID